jgi:hypothetical protein
VNIAYADPPYPGCAALYKAHPDFGGEVDHARLVERLQDEHDGWVLHTSVPGLTTVLPLVASTGARVCAWVKGFAAFKKGIPVAYAWEPVIIKAARKPAVSKRLTLRDWIECGITLRRGLHGAKPEKVCHWAFEVAGARPEDTLTDLFPGTGAVTKAWATWCGLFTLPQEEGAA